MYVIEFKNLVFFLFLRQPLDLEQTRQQLLFSGEVLQISQGGNLHSRHLLLLSDMLLLTRITKEGQLQVVEKPISLQDIVASDYNCKHRK